MADLENLLSELPNLADSLKLTIGDSAELIHEISRITSTQKKLSKIQERLEEALGFENLKNKALGALQFLSPAVALFVPGGFFLEAMIGSGLVGVISNKLGNPDKELSLVDLLESIEGLIAWGNLLKELAEELKNDSEFLSSFHRERKLASLTEQLSQLEQELKFDLAFNHASTLEKQVKKIRKQQQDLNKLQEKIVEIINKLDNSKTYSTDIKTLLIYFGQSIFSVEWIDNDDELLISNAGKVKSVKEILQHCQSLERKVESLIGKASNLRGQAEQSLQYLKEQKRRDKQGYHYQRAGNSQNLQRGTSEAINQGANQNSKFRGRSVLVASISFCILGIAGFIIKFPQSQTASQQPDTPATRIIQPTSPTPVAAENQDLATLEAAQSLAMEAAVMVQNPPHSLEVWQQATETLQEAIDLLETVSLDSFAYSQVQEKLATYRSNHLALTERIRVEKEAGDNFQIAQNLAMEASILVQNPPHSQAIWQEAETKWKQAINLLETIPKGTFVEEKAKEKLKTYRVNHLSR